MKKVTWSTALIAAIMMTSVVGCSSTNLMGSQKSAGEVIDDAVITTKVKASLMNEPGLRPMDINVETYKGVVQLSGFVASDAMAARAVEIARGVNGVQSVKNDMRLK
jgi:hyperosmotically inducible protein